MCLQYRSVLNGLAEMLSDELLTMFDKFVQRKKKDKLEVGAGIPFSQNRALQLWFDMKFVGNIFPRKDEGDVSFYFLCVGMCVWVAWAV